MGVCASTIWVLKARDMGSASKKVLGLARIFFNGSLPLLQEQ